jgi:hypothetical protein
MIDTELPWSQKVAALAAQLGRAPTLDELLPLAAKHRMSPEELRAQRDSFVRAECGFGSDAQEAAHAVALLSGDKEEIARHEAEARARMAAFDKLGGGPL